MNSGRYLRRYMGYSSTIAVMKPSTVQNWLSNPRSKTIKKNMTDHACESGIRVTASGETWIKIQDLLERHRRRFSPDTPPCIQDLRKSHIPRIDSCMRWCNRQSLRLYSSCCCSDCNFREQSEIQQPHRTRRRLGIRHPSIRWVPGVWSCLVSVKTPDRRERHLTLNLGLEELLELRMETELWSKPFFLFVLLLSKCRSSKEAKQWTTWWQVPFLRFRAHQFQSSHPRLSDNCRLSYAFEDWT